MESTQNLLVGVLALEIDLIDLHQFAEAFKECTARTNASLTDILIDRGWISPADKSEIERFAQRRLEKHNGDLEATMAGLPNRTIRLIRAEAADPELQASLNQVAAPATTKSTASSESAPTSEKRYTSFELHAGGGVGRVWVAHDQQLGRDVAIKDLRPEQAVVPAARSRFLKEARITGQLEHPGIVPVYELSHREIDQQPFYAMRFVKGRTLTEAAIEYHSDGSKSIDRQVDLIDLLTSFVTVCNTIAYAHSRGVIHRDLKGQNIILGEFGEVIVLDWGLAKLLDEADEEIEVLEVPDDSDSQNTIAGVALGTPGYMAPEQARGRPDMIDQRTDIYGLGAILYEILTGRAPFIGNDLDLLIDKVVNDEPVPPRQLARDVPRNLEEICLRALAKDPGQRHQSASEMANDVRQWQEVQRQEAVQALRDSEALYHGLVEALPMVVWRKDREGRFTFISPGWTDLFGWASEEILGKTDFEIMPADLAEKYRRDDETVLGTGEGLELDEETTTSDGRRIHIRAFKVPVRNARGEIIGTQGFLWDDSEHKQLQDKLLRTTAELDEYMNRLKGD